MRELININRPLTPDYSTHKHAELYQKISNILTSNPTISLLVLEDLTKSQINSTCCNGRMGMTADQVLKTAIAKLIEDYTYEELAFHLDDSMTLRSFAGYGFALPTPFTSTLHENISKISSVTWNRILVEIVQFAKRIGIENGKQVRGDTTVVESNIAKPCDSKLLLDCVTVLVRFLENADRFFDGHFFYTDHTRRAKRRYMNILNAKKDKEKKAAYSDLLKVTRKTLNMADQFRSELMRFAFENGTNFWNKQVNDYLEQLTHYCDLTERVISQTTRRVIHEKKVQSSEKVVSIFEDHSDIIVKDNRETLYGHKIDLFSGKSGLVLICEILEGNPADSTLAMKMVNDLNKLYGYFPSKVAFDGGFASRENLRQLKEAGVKEIAFSKRRGMSIEDMCTSTWIYKRLRNFRAGIEAVISRLKRCFGLDVCDWKGFEGFKRYVLSAVVSYNIMLIANHLK
jgi:transposase, IS5 family